MRLWTFSRRCTREILRDPLNLFFGLGFPVALILLLTAIQANVPEPLFQIQMLAPGISVFSLSFLTLFSSTLIAKDRESALLQRLYTTPLRPTDFILGYMLPMTPLALLQTIVCYLLALTLGLPLTINIIYAIFATLPMAVFHISLGLFCGSIFNVKQVGGICGALLTNLSGWLSGVWFDLSLVGGTFEKIANMLPFAHAVNLEQSIIEGNYTSLTKHLFPVIVYAMIATLVAIFAFLNQTRKQ